MNQYAELARIVARDYGSMSPLALQVEQMQATLARKDELLALKDDEIAVLMRQNANIYAAFSELEARILEVVSMTRMSLVVDKLVDEESAKETRSREDHSADGDADPVHADERLRQ